MGESVASPVSFVLIFQNYILLHIGLCIKFVEFSGPLVKTEGPSGFTKQGAKIVIFEGRGGARWSTQFNSLEMGSFKTTRSCRFFSATPRLMHSMHSTLKSYLNLFILVM